METHTKRGPARQSLLGFFRKSATTLRYLFATNQLARRLAGAETLGFAAISAVSGQINHVPKPQVRVALHDVR
jgi:hypothetical protein